MNRRPHEDEKFKVSSELQDQGGVLTEASWNDWLAWGYVENGTVLVDRSDSLLVFLYKGLWRGLGGGF